MSRLTAYLKEVTDLTQLEEIGEEVGHLPNEIDTIFEVPFNTVMRGCGSGDTIQYVLVEEDIDGNSYHVVYTDGYIEQMLSADQLDSEYNISVVTTVQVFPLK